MKSRAFSNFLLHAGTIFAFFGIFTASIPVMAGATLIAAAGYGIRDYASRRFDSIDAMSIFALIYGTWMSFGHLLGYFLRNSEYRHVFFAYTDDDFLFEAQILATLGILIPLLTFRMFKRAVEAGKILRVPTVAFETSDATALYICMGLLGLDVASKLFAFSYGSLGTFEIFVASGSEIAIFMLAWHWLGERPTYPRWTLWLLLGTVVADTCFSLMFSFMRGEIIYPFFMVCLAFIVRKAVTPRRVLVAILVMTVFSVVYAQMGAVRDNLVYGTRRFDQIFGSARSVDGSVAEDPSFKRGLLTLAARYCQFDQLTQVARVADEDGFYYGETLSYMTYVFIPRIIWPDKPMVAPGQWFAQRIGKGMFLEKEGRFSNSINMTLQGEFYLNFGWPGAIFGLLLLSLVYAIIWNSTQFYMPGNNPFGLILGLAILRQTTVSSSAAGVLHLVFIYLAVLSVSLTIRAFRRRRVTRVYTGPVVAGRFDGGQAPAGMIHRIGPGTAE